MKINLIFISVLCFIITSTAQSWRPLGVGTTNPVYALISNPNNNLLYAGGIFGTAGGVSVNYIAAWNGNEWMMLGNETLNHQVNALALYNSELIAGGLFEAPLSPGSYLLRWNGSQWYTLGTGPDSYVYALSVDSVNNVLYVGGGFTSIDGVPLNKIAKWDGQTWSALGNGIDDGWVYAIFIDDNGDVYAGGTFENIDGIPFNNIAKWDGNSWLKLENGVVDFVVYDIIKYHDAIFVGGNFAFPGDTERVNIAKWAGNEWHKLTAQPDKAVHAMSVINDELYVCGSFNNIGNLNVNLVAKWNGYEWSALDDTGLSERFTVYTITEHEDDIYIGGRFDSAGGMLVNNIAKWLTPVSTRDTDILENLKISIFPNPANSILNIILPAQLLLPASVFRLYNIQGKAVYEIFEISTSNIIIDVSALPEGFYFYKYYPAGDEKKIITGKVAVQR